MTKRSKINFRILTVALLFAGGVAMAGEQTTDETQIQVRTASGQVEKVAISNLALGEVRTVTSDRGTPVVVGRDERGYVLDVAGERIEVNMPTVDLDSENINVVIDHNGGPIQLGMSGLQDAAHAAGAQSMRRVVLIKPDGADGKSIQIQEGANADQLLQEALQGQDLNAMELGDKRVMVIRKVEKHVTEGQ